MATLLYGDKVAKIIYDSVKELSSSFFEQFGRKVALGTILVGDDLPSYNYVSLKHKKAAELSISSHNIHLPPNATQAQFEDAVKKFNQDETVDAMLIQYPVPAQLNFEKALELIDPNKDVDGLHPLNLGKLLNSSGSIIPCTPMGICALLKYYDVKVQSSHVVILGRGVTIGRPLSVLLSLKGDYRDAVVTLLHSRVDDIKRYTKDADILISAVGSPGIITKDCVKEGSVVIGAGVKYEGKKLLPDVNEDVEEVASFITPRIGGVGPLTVAMLFKNLVTCAYLQKGVMLKDDSFGGF